MMFKQTVGVLVILLIIAILGPFLMIWSWNTLFGTVHTIDYNFWTWLAIIILGASVSTKGRTK